MAVRSPKPTKLSDPFHDFEGDDFLEAVLRKPEGKLDWSDYQSLLGPHLPAGTYHEVVYFLPGAFEHMMANPDSALDLTTPIVGFISNHTDELAKSWLLEAALDRVVQCLEFWTSAFHIIHFDQAACREKGWGRNHFDLVEHGETVCLMTEELHNFARHEDLAVGFYRSMAEFGSDVTKASWFLELSRCRFDVYKPPNVPEIQSLLADRGYLESAAAVVLAHLDDEPSPTYWQDTFEALALA